MSFATQKSDVVIVGGGIAGLSVAAALGARAKGLSVRLLEREPLLASHASGHNAAIFRPLEDDDTSALLARESRALLSEHGEASLLSRTGVLLPSRDPSRVAALARHAAAQGVVHQVLARAELERLAPSLVGGEAESALLLVDGGVLDLHALISRLAAVARSHGVRIETGAHVTQVELSVHGAPRVAAVLLADGTRIAAEHVVIAAGAWSAGLARTAGAILPLTPMRRHLVLLRGDEADAQSRPDAPVVWRLEDELYFRPESGGLLASPCDAVRWPAEVPASDPGALELLAQKLARLAPRLAASRVQRAWACLRTFAPDGELVAGPDPRIAGLFWLAGLGGRGMSVAPAAGAIVARRILGDDAHPLTRRLSPARATVGSCSDPTA